MPPPLTPVRRDLFGDSWLNPKRLALFESGAKQRGKSLFVESSTITIPKANIRTAESGKTIMLENATGRWEAFAVLVGVPLSTYDLNANRRRYGRDLWEHVRDSGVHEGSSCLCDHPPDEEEGENKYLTGVWHNFQVLEACPTADLYLVGSHMWGKLLYEGVLAGLLAGMSTVGYGELLEDKQTVNPRTYELVRPADWVQEPSQGVFATFENLPNMVTSDHSGFSEKRESIFLRATPLAANRNQNLKTTTNGIRRTEKKTMPDLLTEQLSTTPEMRILLESNHRLLLEHKKNDVHRALAEARRTENPAAALQDLSEVARALPVDLTEERTLVQTAMAEARQRIETSGRSKDENVKKLTTERNGMRDIAKALKERSDKYASILDKLGGEDKALVTFKSMREELAALKESHPALEKDLARISENNKKLTNYVTSLVTRCEKLQKEHKKLSSKYQESDSKAGKLLRDRVRNLYDMQNLVERVEIQEKELSDMVGMMRRQNPRLAAQLTEARLQAQKERWSHRAALEARVAKSLKEEGMTTSVYPDNSALQSQTRLRLDPATARFHPSAPGVATVPPEAAGVYASMREGRSRLQNRTPRPSSGGQGVGNRPGSSGGSRIRPFTEILRQSQPPAPAARGGSRTPIRRQEQRRIPLSRAFQEARRSRAAGDPRGTLRLPSPGDPVVREWVEKKVKEYPALTPIRESVLRAPNIVVATQQVEAFLEHTESRPGRLMTESTMTSRPEVLDDSWLDGRK